MNKTYRQSLHKNTLAPKTRGKLLRLMYVLNISVFLLFTVQAKMLQTTFKKPVRVRKVLVPFMPVQILMYNYKSI